MAKILVTGSDGRFGKILKEIKTSHKFIFKKKTRTKYFINQIYK